MVVASGGSILVESGGALSLSSGSTLTVTGGLVRSITQQITIGAKVGATAGWVVTAGDNKGSMGRLPASQSGSTLVVPVSGLPVGATITGIGINGQIESAGGAVTLDMAMRKQTVAAGDLVDAAVSNATITQVAVTADTAVASTVGGLVAVVSADVGYYLLITGTTAGSTDIDLVGVTITYTTA